MTTTYSLSAYSTRIVIEATTSSLTMSPGFHNPCSSALNLRRNFSFNVQSLVNRPGDEGPWFHDDSTSCVGLTIVVLLLGEIILLRRLLETAANYAAVHLYNRPVMNMMVERLMTGYLAYISPLTAMGQVCSYYRGFASRLSSSVFCLLSV